MDDFLTAEFCDDVCAGNVSADADTLWDCDCYDSDYDDDLSDAEADAMTFASAGWGTDEDYGYYGEGE